MNKMLVLTITILLMFTVFGCEDIEDPNPPQRPVMVPKSLPWEYVEKGIDADDIVTGIFVEWYRNPDPGMDGYIVYRAADTSDTGKLDFVRKDTVFSYPLNPMLSDTEFVDTDVDFGTMYYYFVRALGISESKSEPSDTVRYSLTPPPSNCLPNLSEPAENIPDFSWRYSNDFQFGINYYYIRVENLTTRSVIWFYGVPRLDYTGQGQTLRYNADGKASEAVLSPQNTYRWKIDAIGRQNIDGSEIEGSESRWITFQIKD